MNPPRLILSALHREQATEAWVVCRAETDQGDVTLRHFPATGSEAGVLLLGQGGGWSGPNGGRFYAQLGMSLREAGMHALWLRYRQAEDAEQSVLDALVGLDFLARAGARRLALVAHGEALRVAVEAVAELDGVKALVSLAAPPSGLEALSALSPGAAALFVHGGADTVNPVDNSRRAYQKAPGERALKILPGVGHEFSDAVDLPKQLVSWLRRPMSPPVRRKDV
ncbi:hypothetical protein [Alkalilimnicola sp. S0819]|uniref:hypothetical protein n=1 Tax=Alkalilimnicola sp. S0819 TaxID=2613922 RepID=UPI00126255B4|nr:hypothetical protein [Alkalilimnicola sp. S0819]KAB7623675.1 hypothetical protein F3N43_09155 [Alkalilimnicola sp. S0819]MPQ16802.1 hypothetical protein [Alkalilimnicola sp. S0819]